MYFSLKRSLPGMSPNFLFGNVLQTRCLKGESYINIQAKLKEMYGDIYQYWLGPYHYYVFNKAEHAEHVFTHKSIYDLPNLTFGLQFPYGLVSIKGAVYRRHARIILPMFKKANVTHHFDAILNCTDKLIDQWKNEAKLKENSLKTNVAEESKKLLLEIISLAAFKYNLSSSETTNAIIKPKELIEALNAFTNMYDKLVRSAGIPSFILNFYMKFNREYQNALKQLKEYSEEVINRELQLQNNEKHDAHTNKSMSLISALVSSSIRYETTKEGLSREELFDEFLVLILAGYATTSSALSWFIYYMSKFPRIQEKIKAELRKNDITKDTRLTVDLLNKLTYVDCVLKELLRYAPIVNSARRTLTQDDEIDGIQLKKGESVLIPLFNLHMDNRYWKLNPKEFIPERFENEDKSHHPFALLTFGGGHRQCIGQDLARLELKIIITRLMQNLTFIDGGENMNSGGHRQSLTNSPRNIAVIIRID